VAAKFGLGKGLDALLSGTDADETRPEGGGELRLPLDKLVANPNQPRRVFDEDALQELAASIRSTASSNPSWWRTPETARTSSWPANADPGRPA
jgi:ParB family chromosome partitioning protein